MAATTSHSHSYCWCCNRDCSRSTCCCSQSNLPQRQLRLATAVLLFRHQEAHVTASTPHVSVLSLKWFLLLFQRIIDDTSNYDVFGNILIPLLLMLLGLLLSKLSFSCLSWSLHLLVIPLLLLPLLVLLLPRLIWQKIYFHGHSYHFSKIKWE